MAVGFSIDDHVATITIDRPDARNAVNDEVANGIEAAIDRIEEDDTLWVAILTGVPPVFSAGADLKMINAGRGAELITARGGFAGIARRTRTTPVIAAVDGPALAGGTEIVLACDLVVASTTATFGIPEVKRSLVAAGGALFRLPRRIPFNLAMELTLTGDPVGAQRAYELGLVNQLCAPGQALEAARTLARRIASNAPVAVRASRDVLLGAALADEDTGWHLSGAAMAAVMRSDDFREGVTAFIEKRPPRWSGH